MKKDIGLGLILLLAAGTLSAAESTRLLNISTRSVITAGGGPLIAGFVIAGDAPKTVLIRAVGPGLVPLGLNDVLENPKLVVFHGPDQIAANDDWQDGQDGAAVAAATVRAGAFPFADGSKDAAIAATLGPGAYTVHVSSADSRDGVAMVEVYDASGTDASNSRLSNISTRSFAGNGDRTLIAGFVVAGDETRQILIRAIGPTLATQGVDGTLSNPSLQVFRGSSVIGGNDNWIFSLPVGNAADGSVQIVTSVIDTRIPAATRAVGAPSLTSDADAAVLLDLAPGAYTVQVKSSTEFRTIPGDRTEGVAMIEAFEVTPAIPLPTPPKPPIVVTIVPATPPSPPPTVTTAQVTPGAGF